MMSADLEVLEPSRGCAEVWCLLPFFQELCVCLFVSTLTNLAKSFGANNTKAHASGIAGTVGLPIGYLGVTC